MPHICIHMYFPQMQIPILFFFPQEQFIYLFLFIYFGVSWTQGTYPLPYYMNLTDQMIPNIILPSKFGTGIL